VGLQSRRRLARPHGRHEPANTPHFGMTKGEGAVMYFYAVGRNGNTPLEKTGPAGK
jgi:hypothetical protein